MILNDKQISRLLDIANTGCQKGYVYDARNIYEAVLAVKPGFAPANIGLAFSYVVTDGFEKAEEILKDVLAKAPQDEDALVMLGLCYALDKQNEKAFAILKPLADNYESKVQTFANELLALAA